MWLGRCSAPRRGTLGEDQEPCRPLPYGAMALSARCGARGRGNGEQLAARTYDALDRISLKSSQFRQSARASLVLIDAEEPNELVVMAWSRGVTRA